jgi:serine/threonine-protein kinase
MLAGRAAFQGGSVPSVLYQVVHQAPPPLAEANPAVSAAVQAVVERALAKNSDGRFASMREFHDEPCGR